MVDCGPDGAWRIVFANTPAGERAGGPGVGTLQTKPLTLVPTNLLAALDGSKNKTAVDW